MATITYNLLWSPDFTVDYDYDDATLRILSITAVNTSARDYTVIATSTSTGRTYSSVVPPGTTTQTIPAGAANRLQLSVTPSGKLDGVEWQVF